MNTYSWNKEDLLRGETKEDIRNNIDRITQVLIAKKDELPSITPGGLRDVLRKREQLSVELNKLSSYAGLSFAENTKNTEVLAEQKQLNSLGTDIANKLRFYTTWFKELSDEEAKRFIEVEELENYAYHLQRLRDTAQYILDENVENALSLKDIAVDGLTSLYDTITNDYDFEFRGETLTRAELSKHVRSQDPETRREAYEAMYKPFEDDDVVLSELYTNIVLDWVNEAKKLRGYPESITVRNESHDIPDEAVQTLLEVTQENTDIFKKHFELKHRYAEQKGESHELSREHIYAPIGSSKKEYSYEEAKNIVLSCLENFDERFSDAAKQIIQKEHIHSHPKKNKRGGAFCHSSYPGSTPYIMLNHAGTMNDVFTFAHELGHGIHGVLAGKQTKFNFHAVTPMAETASVFAEMLLTDHFLEDTEGEQRIHILADLIDGHFATIQRQVFFTVFEEHAHSIIEQGGSKEDLDAAYKETLDAQFSNMNIPEYFTHEWNLVPHMHHTPFYCYSYAWGNLLVLALYDDYKERGDEFIEDYVELLSAGKSKSPTELLGLFGHDPRDKAFWQRGFNVIKRYVAELEETVAEMH